MNRQPDAMPAHRAKLPRSGHSLGHDFGFTATAAHLLPVFHTFMNAGESITLGLDYLIRTQPLAQAAMTKIKVHTEYFFVPLNLLFEPAPALIFDINDNYSSNFQSDTSNLVLPLLDFDDLFRYVTANRNTFPYGNRQDCLGRSATRLFEHLDLSPFVSDQYTDSGGNRFTPIGNSFPYQLLAYQAIYQYYYRLDTREKFDNSCFNWDVFYGSSLVNSSNSDYNHWCCLHSRPLKDDYYSSVKVSPLVDVLNINDKSILPVVNDWLSRSDAYNNVGVITSGGLGSSGSTFAAAVLNSPLRNPQNNPSSNIQTQFGLSAIQNSSASTSLLNGADISTANLRAIFANEKLWSITGRAKKHYDDQVLAHFGYKVPHDVKHEISCFGHDVSEIHIGEVISTANTGASGSPLGEIAGKGYGQQSANKHKFTAPCHGVVMMIFSIEPDYRYTFQYGRWNQITSREDFFHPEYDHLGMQPMFMYEVVHTNNSNPSSTIFGWEYRYEQWKRRPNKVSNAFAGYGTLNSWMLGKNVFQGTGASIPNTDNYQQFLYKPTDFNQIFLAQYSLSYPSAPASGVSPVYAIYDNDPFIVDSHITANLVSTMSDYSLPRLDA